VTETNEQIVERLAAMRAARKPKQTPPPAQLPKQTGGTKRGLAMVDVPIPEGCTTKDGIFIHVDNAGDVIRILIDVTDVAELPYIYEMREACDGMGRPYELSYLGHKTSGLSVDGIRPVQVEVRAPISYDEAFAIQTSRAKADTLSRFVHICREPDPVRFSREGGAFAFAKFEDLPSILEILNVINRSERKIKLTFLGFDYYDGPFDAKKLIDEQEPEAHVIATGPVSFDEAYVVRPEDDYIPAAAIEFLQQLTTVSKR
jgi:hypothetical protein